MALRLRVVSEHASRLGERTTKVFAVHGGTIGRGIDNEWILPDPERYLSGKHARVDFRAGTYVLVDTSSNGTYVNGSQIPLGKYQDYVLKDGDFVRLGEYELLVSIDKSNDFPPEESGIVAYDGRAPSSAVTKSTADDIGAELDLSQLLEPSGLSQRIQTRDAAETGSGQSSGAGQPIDRDSAEETDSGVHLHNAYGQSAGQPAATPWHMLTRPLKLTPGEASFPPMLRSQNTFSDSDVEMGLQVFCRGAGIDPGDIRADVRGAVLQMAGQLLRESVLGLMDLNQGRHEFRNRFRIPAPPEEGAPSPLDFSGGVEEAMVRLLTTTSTRNGSVEALRGNFRALKAQNTATLAATRAAFEEFLGRLDPKEMEERFDRATKRGVFGQTKAKYWDLYSEMFPGLTHRPADGFPHLFNETFAKAYEAKMRKLLPPQRSTLGRVEEPDPDDQAVGDL